MNEIYLLFMLCIIASILMLKYEKRPIDYSLSRIIKTIFVLVVSIISFFALLIYDLFIK